MIQPLPDSAAWGADGGSAPRSRSKARRDVARRARPGEPRPVVLLAEDDAATADMYAIGLEAAGFRVRVAGDVTAVFAAMETEIPDVAILDYHLSGIITGLDILDNIRLDVRAESLPVLILSNDSGRYGERDRARRAGALAWLRKHETDPVRLAARVSEVLDNHHNGSSSRPALGMESRRIVGPQKGDGVEDDRPEAIASQRDSSTADEVYTDGLERPSG